MVLTLVLLPVARRCALGPRRRRRRCLGPTSCWPLAITLGKVAVFVALMLVVGRRLIPWAAAPDRRHRVARAVHPGRAGAGARYRLRRGRALRRLLRARRLLRRAWCWPSPSSATARPRIRCRSATPSRCCSSSRSGCSSTRRCWSSGRWRSSRRSSSSSCGKSIAAYVIVRAFGHSHVTGADHLRQPGADRRVFLHSGGPRPHPRAARARGAGASSSPARFCRSCSTRSCSPIARPAGGQGDGVGAPPPSREPGSARAVVGDRPCRRRRLRNGRAEPRRQTLRSAGRPFLVIDDREEEMAKLRAEGVEHRGRQRRRRRRAAGRQHRAGRLAFRRHSERLRGRPGHPEGAPAQPGHPHRGARRGRARACPPAASTAPTKW